MTDICNLCGKAANLMCQRCNETYCSTNCQILDWRVHKKVCFQMPTLIPIKEFVSKNLSFVSSGDSPRNRTPSDNRNIKRTFNRNPLKIPPDDTLACSPQQETSANAKALTEVDFTLKPKLVVKESEMKSNVSQCSKVSNRTAAWRTPFTYPEGVFFDVVVQYAEEDSNSDIVWVTKLKYEGALRKLLAEINRNIDVNTNRCSKEEIQVGALIAAPFENLYYRAEIIEVIQISKMVLVHLIDYGNLVEVAFTDLRSPIPIMRNLNSYAFRIHYTKPVELEKVLSICVIKNDPNGVAIVQEKKPAIGMPVLLTAEAFSTDPTVSVAKISVSGKHALLRLMNELVTRQLEEMDKFLNTNESSQFLITAPKDGDYVVAKTLHGWARAVVMSTYRNDYLVYLVDEGRITLVEQVLAVPQNVSSIPLQVFAVELTSEGKTFKDCLSEGKTYAIKVRNSSKTSSDRISCLLVKDDGEKLAEIEMFNYIGKSTEVGSGDWIEPLISGSEVFITNVVSHFEIFISLVCTKLYPNIFSAAAEDCAPLENGKYDKGDLVLLETENEYFRAKILQPDTQNDNIEVLQVDTGLQLTASKKAMKKPNIFVHSCPYYTRRVKLMYLSSVATPYNDNKALEMLEQCQEKGAEFVLKFNSNPELGVELLLKNGDQQSLNKQLLPMLFEKRTSSKKEKETNKDALAHDMVTPPPSPKVVDQPVMAKKIYTLKNLEFIPITCGDNVPVMVLDNSTISKGYISCCDFTNKHFLMQLDSEYMPMLAQHCASLDTSGEYSPSIDEICLAVYDVDKEWYRGVCLNQMKDDMFCVMFIDYGNMSRVHKSNIRPITSNLMFPSNANICFFEGIPDEVPLEKCDKFIMATQADPKIFAKVTKVDLGSYLLKIRDMDKYF